MMISAASSVFMAFRSRMQLTTNSASEGPVVSPVNVSGGSIVSGNSGRDVSNLSEDIARRLVQDLDYQILKKNFALDAYIPSAKRAATRLVDLDASAPEKADTVLRSRLSDVRGVTLSERRQSQGLAVFHARESIARLELSFGQEVPGSFLQTRQDQRQSIQLDVQFEQDLTVQRADPLVLDLSGRGISTTGLEAGVEFDLTGDGVKERVSFVTGDTWFLALDLDDNGRIDNGKELFGDQHGAANGFNELARYDANADQVIDAEDAVFARLRLFQLGSQGEQQLKSLKEGGIGAIELGYQSTQKALNLYDSVAQTSQYRRLDGSQGVAADLMLGYRSLA